MINDGKLLAIANFQKVFSIWLREGIGAQFHFFVRVKTRIWSHKIECEKAVEMIATQEPLNTTNEHCWKSPRRQPLYRQRLNLGATWCCTKSGLLPWHNVGVMLKPHLEWSTLLPETSQQNYSPEVLSTLSPYQWQLRSWKLNVRSLHLPIGELLCWKRQPWWRRVSSRRTDANNMLYTKVLPDPPRLSRKNTAPLPWVTTLNTIVTTISWQMLSRGRF